MTENWHFDWQERTSLLIGIAHQKACLRLASKTFKIPFNGHFIYWKNGQSHGYFSKESIQAWRETSSKFLIRGYLKKFLKETKKARVEFYQAINDIEQANTKNATNGELLRLFRQYYEKVIAIRGIYLGSAPSGVYHVDNALKELLKEELQKEDIEHEHSILSTPEEIDLTQEELISRLNLVDKNETKIFDHAKDFAAFFFNSYDKDAIRKYIKETQEEKEITKEILEMHEHKQTMLKKRKELEHDLSDDTMHYAKVLRELAVDRLKLKNCWSGAELLALDLFQEISTRIKIPVKEFFQTYTYEDVEVFLQKGQIVSKEQREKRKQANIFKVEKGEAMFISGSDAEKEINKIFGNKDHSKESTVKGMVANAGRISGKARVVLVEDIEEYHKALVGFEQDDILITTMTSPNMVPIIKKAAGIVTNEGGICSHAAIISREITTPRKKPCIVGTKDATRIFKTGDYILIDGQTREVKKITKEEHEQNIEQLKRQLEE